MNAFQLLVASLVAIAVLAFFLQVLAPLFVVPSNGEKSLRSGIESAKFHPRFLVSAGTLPVVESDSFSVAQFADLQSDLAFECNSPEYCCNAGMDCGTSAFWNAQRIRFDRAESIPVFVRCEQLVSFFGCTVFFGTHPPQLELKNVRFDPTLDLSKNPSATFSIDLLNSGKTPALNASADLVLYWKEGDKREELTRRHLDIGEVQAAEIRPLVLQAPVTRSGTIEAVVSVSGDNAGADSKTVMFSAQNAPQSPCHALTDAATTRDFDVDSDMCRERFACNECTFAFQCLAAWQKAQPDKSFVEGDYSFAAVLTEQANGACPQ
ncbi:MAG: hypothetical protein Q7R47_03365 [Candidatus Diapherotrites archaeon]|nr:hypothetical protein [Candidatus Diapherotrites archaeon]